MSDPGWSNDWWGRDPIEEAEEEVQCDCCGKIFPASVFAAGFFCGMTFILWMIARHV